MLTHQPYLLEKNNSNLHDMNDICIEYKMCSSAVVQKCSSASNLHGTKACNEFTNKVFSFSVLTLSAFSAAPGTSVVAGCSGAGAASG